MVKYSTQQLAEAMKKPENIRNFTVVAQIDHGKSSLTDSLLLHAGLIAKDSAGLKRETDTMKQEQERGITIKSVGVSLMFPLEGTDYVFNVIDSPGHVDFSAEVTAALRATDGAMVLMDTVEGVRVQTETVLRQALTERIQPVVVLNKIDRLFLELKLAPEEVYQTFVRNIEDINVVISTYQDDKFYGDMQCYATNGRVVYTSARQGWGFSLIQFARLYAKKFGTDTEKMLKRLWGDNFFDPKTKKWSSAKTDANERGFNMFIVKPIQSVIDACFAYPDKNTLETLVEKLAINLPKKIFAEHREKDLIRHVLQAWLPVAECMVELVVSKLPSPKVAQKHRGELIYSGPDDEVRRSIEACDPNGPLLIYVSKMVPTADNSHFYAFGRVFSGTARSGKVKVLMDDHTPENVKSVNASVQKVVLMMAKNIEAVEEIGVGNTLGLDGVDKAIVKTATIATTTDCFPCKSMAFSVSPVVQVSLKPKRAGELPKFTEGIKKFIKSDPCLVYKLSPEGEHILAGAGELHLDVAVTQLREDYLKSVEFTVGEPIVPYCETCIAESDMLCLSKSPNNHNRLFGQASPLGEELCIELETKALPTDAKALARHLIETYGWGDEARKVWCVMPEVDPVVMFVDGTKGIQYLNEIKDSVSAGLAWACQSGPLCEEPMRGVRIALKDAVLHADAIHRGGGQILPATRRLIYATVLRAKPRLMEPIYKLEVSAPRVYVGQCYSTVSQRNGAINNEESNPNNPLVSLTGVLPVASSFGFIEELRSATSGQAFAQYSFSHWQVISSDPLEEGSRAFDIVRQVRKRKGLTHIDPPPYTEYHDKL